MTCGKSCDRSPVSVVDDWAVGLEGGVWEDREAKRETDRESGGTVPGAEGSYGAFYVAPIPVR